MSGRNSILKPLIRGRWLQKVSIICCGELMIIVWLWCSSYGVPLMAKARAMFSVLMRCLCSQFSWFWVLVMFAVAVLTLTVMFFHGSYKSL